MKIRERWKRWRQRRKEIKRLRKLAENWSTMTKKQLEKEMKILRSDAETEVLVKVYSRKMTIVHELMLVVTGDYPENIRLQAAFTSMVILRDDMFSIRYWPAYADNYLTPSNGRASMLIMIGMTFPRLRPIVKGIFNWRLTRYERHHWNEVLTFW